MSKLYLCFENHEYYIREQNMAPSRARLNEILAPCVATQSIEGCLEESNFRPKAVEPISTPSTFLPLSSLCAC